MTDPSELAKKIARAVNANYAVFCKCMYDCECRPVSQSISDAGLADLEARLGAAEREIGKMEGWTTAMHRKLSNYIGPQIFRVRKDLCSCCTGKGTGLICSDCSDDSAQEAIGFKRERDEARGRLKEIARRARKMRLGVDYVSPKRAIGELERLATEAEEEGGGDGNIPD